MRLSDLKVGDTAIVYELGYSRCTVIITEIREGGHISTVLFDHKDISCDYYYKIGDRIIWTTTHPEDNYEVELLD